MLAEVVPIDTDKKVCGACGEPRPLKRFKKADLDNPDARCAACRVPHPIADPETPPGRVICSSIDIPLPDSWRAKIALGTKFRCEVVMHIDGAWEADDGSTQWRARWLEVTRLED